MDKFQILFIKDDDLNNAINKIDNIWNVYEAISITSNKIKNPYLDSLALFISYFFSTCLSLLPDLYNGQSGKFELEGPFELIFQPGDSKIAIYLHRDDKLIGGKLHVTLKEFARETIKVTQEFIEYTMELRPDLKKSKTTKELQDKINVARIWYLQKYNEKI